MLHDLDYYRRNKASVSLLEFSSTVDQFELWLTTAIDRCFV